MSRGRDGRAGGNIYVSVRDRDDQEFENVFWLGPQHGTEFRHGQAALTPDELMVIISVGGSPDTGGGLPGEFDNDLWIATRARAVDENDNPLPFGNLQKLEGGVNTLSAEAGPSLSSDGLTVFWYDWPAARDGGRGQSDIWMSTRSAIDQPFEQILNVPGVNTATYETVPYISPDWPATGSKIYFSRFAGSSVNIYEATWHPDCNRNAVDDREEITARTSLDENGDELPDECALRFVRGESNNDNAVDLADAVHTLAWLFSGGPEPACLAAVNSNGDQDVDIADPVYLLSFLFQGDPSLPGPFPGCGSGTLGIDAKLGCAVTPRACP